MEVEEIGLQPTSYLKNGALSWLMSTLGRSSSSIQQYFLNRSLNTHTSWMFPWSRNAILRETSSPLSSAALPPSPPPPLPSSSTWDYRNVFMRGPVHVHLSSPSTSISPPPSLPILEEPNEGTGAPPWMPPKPKLMKATSTHRNSLNYSPKLPLKKPTYSNLQTSPSPSNSHPVFEILHQQELGKSILVLAMPMVAGLYSFFKPLHTPLLLRFSSHISFGGGCFNMEWYATTSNMQHWLPHHRVVSCFLPNLFILVPVLCWILALLPFVIAFCFRGRAAVEIDEERRSLIIQKYNYKLAFRSCYYL